MLGFVSAFHTYKPHLLMTLAELALAGFMILLESLFTKGISPFVLVVYEHIVATFLLGSIAFFFEKRERPPISCQILCLAFVMGLLQVTLCQMFATLSLKYLAATYQSLAINMITPVVFVLSVVFRQEQFVFRSIYGQAKLCGVVISTGAAVAMVLWTGPVVLKTATTFQAVSDGFIGGILLVGEVLSSAVFTILVAFLTRRYPPLSSTALLLSFGTIQATVVTLFVVPGASWKIGSDGALEIVAILYGGIVVTGLSYYVQIWCIHKRGPVFTIAFSPLLIVFSFLLDTVVLREVTYLGSIVGAVLVIGGLYLLLWAQAKEMEREREVLEDGSINSPLLSN